MNQEIKDFIKRKINELGRNEFIKELTNTLGDLNKYPSNNSSQIRYYRKMLKMLLIERFGDGRLMAKNIKLMGYCVYPPTDAITVEGFKQYEVAFDCTERPRKLGVVLDIYDEVYKSETPNSDEMVQELRMDTNGVMCDHYLKKVTIDNFMRTVTFNSYENRLILALLGD